MGRELKEREVEGWVREAINYGKKLYEKELVDGASGNLSFRLRNSFYITKTGTNLELLDIDSFVEMEIKPHTMKEVKAKRASSDALVHERVYLKTEYRAVLHCHGLYNVVLSLFRDKIEPMDLEGKIFLGEIEVLEGQFMSEEIAEDISDSISKKGYAVVKGHGIYAAGNSFREAFNLLSYAEHSCRVIYLKELLDKS